MSYKSIFSGTAATLGAVALSTQMASAEPQLTDVQMFDLDGMAMDEMTMDDLVPPQVRPFIGDMNFEIKVGVDFEAGLPVNGTTDLNITNIQCDMIEPLFEQMDAAELAQGEHYGYERSAQEQAAVDSIRSLFQNRVLDLTQDDLSEMLGHDAKTALNDFYDQTSFDQTSMDIHLECAGYKAPAPGM